MRRETGAAGVDLLIVSLRDIIFHFIVSADAQQFYPDGARIHVILKFSPLALPRVPGVSCFRNAGINGAIPVNEIVCGGVAFKKYGFDVSHIVRVFRMADNRAHKVNDNMCNC